MGQYIEEITCNYRLDLGGDFTFLKKSTSAQIPICFAAEISENVYVIKYKTTLVGSGISERVRVSNSYSIDASDFDYCTTYDILEGASNGEIIIDNSRWTSLGTTYTTPPARPIVAIYSVSGRNATVTWGFEDNNVSQYTKIVFELFNVNNLTTPVQTKILYDNSYISGSIEFTDIPTGSYIVKAQTIYTVRNTDIPCCYTAVSDDAASSEYKAETAEFTVGMYRWTYSYIDTNGNAVLGTSKETRQYDKFLYITAAEWNGLCEYVRGMIGSVKCATPINSDIYALPPSTTYGQMLDMAVVEPGEDIKATKFNYLSYVISSNIAPTGITAFIAGEVIKPEYFNTLIEKVNM